MSVELRMGLFLSLKSFLHCYSSRVAWRQESDRRLIALVGRHLTQSLQLGSRPGP
jgi:hypothetical protein